MNIALIREIYEYTRNGQLPLKFYDIPNHINDDSNLFIPFW